MKYIRTKDGRIFKFHTSDVKEEIAGIKYDILGFKIKTTMQFYDFKKEDIVKITDTIEDLCDEFVVKDIDGKYVYITADKPWTSFLNCIIYGAIWCEWGLKYVARMNSDGVLELL